MLNFVFVGAFIAGLAGLSPCARKAACVIISVKAHFSDHVKIRFISQLINSISKVLQKLLKCFNDTTVLTSFVLLSLLSLFGVFPIILILYLNDAVGVGGLLLTGGLRGRLLGASLQ